MKNIIFSLFLFAGAITFASAQSDNKYDTIKIQTSAECDMCKETLEKALAYEKGVKSSNLHVKSKVITVVYRPDKTSPDKIRKAISMTGYDADDVPADPKAYDRLDECCKKGTHKED